MLPILVHIWTQTNMTLDMHLWHQHNQNEGSHDLDFDLWASLQDIYLKLRPCKINCMFWVREYSKMYEPARRNNTHTCKNHIQHIFFIFRIVWPEIRHFWGKIYFLNLCFFHAEIGKWCEVLNASCVFSHDIQKNVRARWLKTYN